VSEKCYCCGYNDVLIKHHPDGREEIIYIFVSEGGNTHDMRSGLSKCVRRPRHPENVVMLCPNCHALHHRKSMSLDEIKNMKRVSAFDLIKAQIQNMTILINELKTKRARYGLSKEALVAICELEIELNYYRSICGVSGGQ